jgi:hypothetical protein
VRGGQALNRVAHPLEFGFSKGAVVDLPGFMLHLLSQDFPLPRPDPDSPNFNLQSCNLQTFQRLTAPFQ